MAANNDTPNSRPHLRKRTAVRSGERFPGPALEGRAINLFPRL